MPLWLDSGAVQGKGLLMLKKERGKEGPGLVLSSGLTLSKAQLWGLQTMDISAALSALSCRVHAGACAWCLQLQR